jgi:hypothetical protein
MAITPLSTPITTEYKPLGLEAFAVPLSQLQKKFDLTQEQLNKTEYSLDHLKGDDERTKQLMGDLNQTTADLSEALVNTGNFREVANRLGKLNKYYNKNPELAAIKSNHTAYKTAWAEMDKLRQKDKISATQLKNWENWAKGNFGGTNYDKETGAYNTGNFRVTGPDVRKEMMEEARTMAKMTQETKDAYITRMVNLGVSGEEAARLAKISLEERNKDKVAVEIANVLKKIPKYSDYLSNEAEINFYNQNESKKREAFYSQEDPLSFSKEILKSSLPGLDARKKTLETVLAQDNLTDAQREYLEKDLEELSGTIEDVNLGISGTDTQLTEDLAEAFYKADAVGYIDDLSSSTADLVDFVHRDISGIGGGGGVSSDAKKKIDAVGDIVISIDEVTSTSTPKVSEGISSTYIEESNQEVFGKDEPNNLNELFRENENVKANSLASETITRVRNPWTKQEWDRKDPDTYKIKDEDGNYVLPDIYQNGADVAALDFFNKKYDEKVDELDGELVDLNTQLNELSPNSAEYREVSSKIVNIYNDRNQNILAKTKQLKDLDYNINELFISLQNAGLGTKDFSFEKLQSSLENLSKMNGFNQFSGFAKELQNRYDNKSETGKKKFMKELAQVAAAWSNNESNSTGFLSELQKISEDNIQMSVELSASGEGDDKEIGVKFTNEMFQSTDPSSLIIRSIFDQFKLSKTLGSEGYVQIPSVNYTEGLNAYTDGAMEEIKNLVINNPSNFPRLDYDPVNKTSSLAKKDFEGETYDIQMYSENPTIVGRDEQNRLILKYEKKPQYRKANSGTKQYFKDIINGKTSSDRVQDPEDYLARFDSDDVEMFEKNNPNELYVSTRNLTVDPILNAENNYIDLVVAGLNSGNTSEGIEIVEQQRNNYAPLHLINKKERSLKYSKMAKTLSERAQKGIKGESFQGPAHTQDNGDGSFTDYGIVYKTTTDNKIIAQVTKTTRIPSNEKGVADEILEKIELPSTNITMGQNLPLTLLKMDMTFGTGDEDDLVTVRRNGYDIPFIIAFEQGFVFEDPNTNIQAMDNISK